MPHPHPADSLFQRIFSRRANAIGLLRSALPDALLRTIDLSTLRLEPGAQVDEDLRRRFTDLLFSVAKKSKRRGGRICIALIVEHQSTVDPVMAYRILRYQQGVMSQRYEATGRFWPVIGVVFYQGARRWTAPRQMLDLYELPPESVAGTGVLQSGFILEDLSQLEDEQLLRRAMSAAGRLALFALKHGRERDILARIRRAEELMTEVAVAESGTSALATIFRYINEVNASVTRAAAASVLRLSAGPAAEEAFMNEFQMERQEGREEGAREELHEAILSVLDSRGVPVSRRIRTVIARCTDLRTLRRWLREAATAASGDALMGMGQRTPKRGATH